MNVDAGLQFTFTKYLVPEIYGRIGKKDKGVWKFVGKSEYLFMQCPILKQEPSFNQLYLDNLDSSVLEKSSTEEAISLTEDETEVDVAKDGIGDELNGDAVLTEEREMDDAIVKLGGNG